MWLPAGITSSHGTPTPSDARQPLDPDHDRPVTLTRDQYLYVGGEVASSPKPIHLTGDTRPGIVFGTSLGLIYVVTADGVVANGWPVASGSTVGYATAAVADLDDDGSDDIVFHANNSLEAYAQDGTPLPGWPQTLDGGVVGNSIMGAAVVADIDDDGDLEVIVGHVQRMFAFHHDGTLVDGWPVWQSHAFGPLFSTAAVGDIDNDGDAEICFKIYGGNGDPADIHLLHHDGSPVAGWPRLGLDRSHVSSPMLADLDDDGTLDIVVTLHYYSGGNYVRVYAWHADGTDLPGFPVAGSWNCVPESNSVGDVDDDGLLEIFVGTSNGTSPYYAVHAWNHDGTTLAGAWPRSASRCLRNSSPALVDIDGGLNEVIVGTGGCYVGDDGVLNAWAVDGSPVAGWPQTVTGHLRSSPLVMDSDADGTPEIYIGSMDGWMHRFLTSNATGGSEPEWNQVFHDPCNTNCYRPPPSTGIGEHDAGGSAPRLSLAAPQPNPFRFQTSIRYDVREDGSVVDIAVFDVHGRRVVDLVRGRQPAGTHSVSWQGLNAAGSRVGAGVYFVRLDTRTGRETREITLVR